MKARFFLFAIATVAAFACNKEAAQVEPAQQEILITAYQEGSQDTKTSLQSGGTQVFWEYGDNITVFYEGKGSEFQSLITDLNNLYSYSVFSGVLENLPVGSSNAANKKIWGLYPSNANATSDGNSVTTTLPDDQVGKPGSFFKRTQITLACANSFSLPFYNVTGGLRFSVSQSGIRSVILEGNNGENLAGTVKLAFEGGVPVVKSVTDGSKSISLTAPRGDYFKKGEWYYIVALPGALSNGFKMTFRKDTETGVLNSSEAVSIKRGVFGSISNIDKNVTFSTEATGEILPEIHNGDVVLATNPLVEKFLTEVTYPERDYTYSKLLNYPPCAPGQADLPPVYAIKWTADASAGALTATLKDGDWQKVSTLPAGSSFMEVSNLRPNATYTYEVKAAGGSVITSGSFTTTGHLHQLFFQKQIRNCRDLGGWKTKDGKTVKYRKVYRGGRLESKTLTDQGRADILAEGIKAQLDLRGEDDVLSSTALGSGYAFCAPVIEQGYSTMLKNYGSKVKQCFEFIVQCTRENKPVYFHCSLGRDRTGTMGMLVLGILGVNEGDISKEYEVTQFSPHYWGTSDGEHTIMTRLADYDGAANYIWDNYVSGSESFARGMEKYLLSIGVSQSDIDDFRSLMLE
ncbi:MAG: tyrosine-protein phosphatase [Bacteroidales bacterium]|nr:tyrosine-protein phosphatase [Bacteroidales bacterium]